MKIVATRLCARYVIRVMVDPEHDLFLDSLHDPVQPNSHQREDKENRKHARGVHRKVSLQDEVTQARLRSDELADDGTYNGKDNGDVEANEYIGQRVGNLHVTENLPFRACERDEQIDLLARRG